MKHHYKLSEQEFENLVNPTPSFSKLLNMLINCIVVGVIIWFLFFKLWDKI